MYTEYKNLQGNIQGVLREADGAWIPCDTANSDYREYLSWKDTQPKAGA